MTMTDRELEEVAERTAAKIAQGLLRMPDDLRAALAALGSTGHYSVPGPLTPGPDAYYLQAVTRSGGIQLDIRRPDGSRCWSAVIV